MEPTNLKFTWKTVLFPLLGLVGFFLYLYIFQVDIIAIIQTAQSANPIFFAAATVCSIIEVLFYTLSWRTLTTHLNIKMTLKRAYLYVWYGLYVDIIVPAESVSGEITRAYLLTRDQCGPFGKIVASLFMHRLLGMAMNVAILILGVAILSTEGQISSAIFNLIIVMATAIAALTIILTIISFKKTWALKILSWTTNLVNKISRGKWALSKFKEQTIEIINNFHQSMIEYSQNKKPLITSFFYLALTWLFSLSVPYLVFQSLGYQVSWSIILITAAIVLAVKSIPIGIPFEVGIPEAAMTTLYIAMGVDPAVAATATILSRVITLWFRFFIGFISQQYLELKTKKTKA